MSEHGFTSSSTPVPDPTLLTTEQLRLGLNNLRELLETRLTAMDKATDLFSANAARASIEADKQINHLKELHDERFRSIQRQFEERDVRSAASEDAAKIAVNAALQAQKEAAAAQNESNAAAITKSESTTVKQIDGIMALLASNSLAASDKITVINGRLDRGEGVTKGGADNSAKLLATVAVAVAVVGVMVSLYSSLRPTMQSQPAYIATAPAVVPVH